MQSAMGSRPRGSCETASTPEAVVTLSEHRRPDGDDLVDHGLGWAST